MLRQIITRLVAIVPILLILSVFAFLLVHLAPGDVTDALLGPMATEEAKRNLREAMGLDRPLIVQYVTWLGNVLQGDFGVSVHTQRQVVDMVLPRFTNTVILAGASLFLALTVGFTVGMFAAARSHSLFDRVSMSTTLMVGSMPPYWLALLLVLAFALEYRWFPATGMTSITGDGGLLDILHHLVLPAIATAAAPAAIITRMVRSSMLEVLGQNYVKVARAKGIPRRKILWRHALRNALPPIATISGLQLGFLLGGALFTEVVFAWPGLGNQLYYSIVARDVPVVQAAILIIALAFVLVNLAIDILNALLDPRVRTM
ncbi:MAG: ABC transporter permease [Rhodospirillales bacterium]